MKIRPSNQTDRKLAQPLKQSNESNQLSYPNQHENRNQINMDIRYSSVDSQCCH